MKPVHSLREISSQNERSNKSRTRNCYSCGSTSHLKKECTSKKNTEALCCDALLAVGDADDWFLDSGATEHMSKKLCAFYEYSDLSEPHPVKIGNGSIMYGIGVGKINVLVFDGQKWLEKHLVDVLQHVCSEIACKLILARAMLGQRLHINIKFDRMCV